MLNGRGLLVETLEPELLQRARELALPTPPGIPVEPLGFHALADYLKVRVTERGSQRVAITLPACQAAVLEDSHPRRRPGTHSRRRAQRPRHRPEGLRQRPGAPGTLPRGSGGEVLPRLGLE